MKLLTLVMVVLYTNMGTWGESEPADCVSGSAKCDYKQAVLRLAETLSNMFHDIVTTELLPDVDSLPASPLPHTAQTLPASPHAQHTFTEPTDEELLSEITEKLTRKLSSAINILSEMNSSLAASNTPSYTRPCPYKSMHKPIISKSIDSYDNVSSLTEDYKSDDSIEELKIKKQYFLSHIDYATDKDCTTMPHSNLRYLYHKVVNPDPKLVIFIIDNSISVNSIQYAVGIVKEISQAMQATDLLALKLINMTDFVQFEDACSSEGMADISNATDTNKLLLKEYLITVDTAHPSVPHAAINKELQVLLSRSDLPQHKLIVFLTDTKVLTDESWPKMFPYPIKEDDTIKLAIGVINEGEESSSLEILHFDRWHNHSKSHSLMRVHITDGGVVGQAASAFISLLPGSGGGGAGDVRVGSPVWEPTERDFIVSVTAGAPAGVLGLDLYWSELAEDLIYFPHASSERRRAFVLDRAGLVVMHSSFPRPEFTADKIRFTTLDRVEPSRSGAEADAGLAARILATPEGHLTRLDGDDTLTYRWRHAGPHYAVCVVSVRPAAASEPAAAPAPSPPYPRAPTTDMLFHRLDLAAPRGGRLCRHFKQLATVDRGTVFLSPSSFRSPFTYLREASGAAGGGDGGGYLRNCLAYLRAVVARGLLANPGLRGGVRRDVGYIGALLPGYRRRQLRGPLARHAVRRYVAADSGALGVFPGAVLDHDYEPVRRGWHVRARRHPSRLVLSPPALDPGGAGYVVTLSRRAPAPARAVLALDLALGYVHRLLEEALPLCGGGGGGGGQDARCFLLDARGYLVAHPALQGPAAAGPVERRHVTHQESLVAIDMLTQRQLVAKRECRSTHDGSTQRFYEFNTSLVGALSNAAPGEPCLRYYIAAVPRVEALVALVTSACRLGAFCPCSMVDRACLNCNRMEQTECECPCECAAEPARCPVPVPATAATAAPAAAPLPACEPPPETDEHKSHYFHNLAENLKPCVEPECESVTSRAACRGVAGCEWCQAEAGGAPLPAPFCATQAACWSGVLGSVTPYGEGTYREPAGGGATGPVVGCLVTAGLVCAVAAYCYRQSAAGAGAGGAGGTAAAALYEGADTWGSGSGGVAGAGAGSGGAAGGGGAESGSGGAGRERLLPAPVSPYRVVGGVRCARAAGSDHGYSTMTPHEDSEAAGGAPPDPAPAPAPATACPASAAAPAPAPAPGTTRLLAPVTVHRHMEAVAEHLHVPPPSAAIH